MESLPAVNPKSAGIAQAHRDISSDLAMDFHSHPIEEQQQCPRSDGRDV
jgi:hypothetical protein